MDSRWKPWEGDEKLHPGAPVVYFGTHRSFPDLEGYRSLCNGFKAALIEGAAQLARRTGKTPRLAVVDVGSGRGGDINKWDRYRPRLYVGVDGSAASVAEAQERHRKLVSDGRGGLVASFVAVDVRYEPLPLPDEAADIASLQFSLQYAFDTAESASHLISELRRVVRPGGVVAAMLPDGDRLAALLSADPGTHQVTFGHFIFRKFEKTLDVLKTANPPVGIPYCFTLGSRRDSCPEYVVSPKYLEQLFVDNGFEGALCHGKLSVPAHDFYTETEQKQVVASLTRARPCNEKDWATLGAFRVLLARRTVTVPEQPDPVVPAQRKQAKQPRRRRQKEAAEP